jgi:hypothetical protein
MLARPSLAARSMLAAPRFNSVLGERASFSSSSRALSTPPPTGPLTPPPASPRAVKVKVRNPCFNSGRLLTVSYLSDRGGGSEFKDSDDSLYSSSWLVPVPLSMVSIALAMLR